MASSASLVATVTTSQGLLTGSACQLSHSSGQCLLPHCSTQLRSKEWRLLPSSCPSGMAPPTVWSGRTTAVAALAVIATARKHRRPLAGSHCGALQEQIGATCAQTCCLRAYESELGVQAPLYFWDPMGFTDDGDVEAYRRRRSVELKHGRIAMLATMGYITPEIAGKWPGYLSPSMDLKFSDVPSGLQALPVVPGLGWAQILVYFMFVEYTGGFEDYKAGTPGDYGWKVLTASDPVERRRKLNAELANGRLAMVAIMAMLFQNGLAGTTGPEMWLPQL